MGNSYSLGDQSDIELLTRLCRHDDCGAFRILYDRYWEKLYLLAYRKVQSETDALDIIQNIFVKFWEKRHEVQISKSLDGYLFIALKNSILNYYKHRIIRKKHTVRFCSQNAMQEETIHNNIYYKELHISINREIGQLPEKMREVFDLSRNHHLSAREIAQKLSISEQTVRNQISDALHRIRIRIAERQ